MILYKYRGLSNLRYVADILCHERLYCAPYTELNDPFEGFFYFEDRILEPCGDWERLYRRSDGSQLVGAELHGTRVCSLSSDPWEVRLWALYADSCRGVVFEIEFPEALDQLHKVNYSRKLPSFLEARSDLKPFEALTHKTAVWQYESEYRIITSDSFWNIQGQIRRVIVGPRCSAEDRTMLERMAPEGVCFVAAEAKETWQAVVSKLPPDYKNTHGMPRSTRRMT